MNQTLTQNVAKLQSLLSNLKTGDAKFASDLIASFKKYGGLTPKQEPWIERLIARAVPTFQPATSYLAAKPEAPAAVTVGDFAGVLKLFVEAKAHLKYPKIRLQVEGKKVILALNGEKSKKPGHVTLKSEGSYPNYTFYGSVSPEGVFTPANATYGAFKTALITLLTDLAANPARVAKDYAKLTGNCCFCGKDIGYGKEVRSVLVGFGPDCAEHYGLKGEWLAAAEKAEAKASVAAPKLSVQDEVIESLVAQQQAVKAVIDQYAQLPAENLPKFTVFASYEPTAKTWAPGTANEAADGTPLNTLGQPILTGHSDAVLAAEAQHEAAYEAKAKDDAFWSAVGTSIEALGEPAPVVSEAAEKPEWVKAFQEGAVAAGLDPVAFQTGPATKAYWEAADQANKAQAAKLEVLSKSLLFQKVDEQTGYTVTAGWAGQVPEPVAADDVVALVAESDGPVTATVAETPHTCFFCEQQVEAVKILHGYSVCFTCVEQLKG